MGAWRYFCTRLNGDGTETPLAWDLPLSGPQITQTLSGPDALTATVTPEVARLTGADGRPVFVPWSTAVYAEASGQIRAGCIVTPTSSMTGPDYSIDAVGFYGYAGGMPYTGDRSRVQADPLDEARHIWEHLQAAPRGDLGLVLDDTTSPVRIGTESEDDESLAGSGDEALDPGPYKLNWWSTDDLGAELEKLAKATPFDFREEHAWEGDNIVHRLRLGYPRLGRRRDDLRFVLGENVRAIPQVNYSDDYASEVHYLGAGEGRKMVHGTAHRPDSRLRRAAVVSDKSVRSKGAADAAAAREVADRLGDGDVSQVVVSDHPHATVGSFSAGDDVFVQVGADTGWAAVDLWCRVTAVTFAPADGAAATLTLIRSDRVEA